MLSRRSCLQPVVLFLRVQRIPSRQLKNMGLFGVPFWAYAGYFAVTLSPEADMIRYGKQAVFRSHKKLRTVHGHI